LGISWCSSMYYTNPGTCLVSVASLQAVVSSNSSLPNGL
jgi:hypothetical protein